MIEGINSDFRAHCIYMIHRNFISIKLFYLWNLGNWKYYQVNNFNSWFKGTLELHKAPASNHLTTVKLNLMN